MSTRPKPRLAALLCVVALLAAACGGGSDGDTAGSTTSASADTTLVGALMETFNPDPDQYFSLEGVVVTNSVYESLVVNPPQSTEIEGLLAESWEISEDGLTYTFTLRPDITFADGTPIDAAAMQASFERRTAAEGSPSYMLGEVERYETPDDRTFVIHLSQPVNNFLSRLASPWAPMAINPAVIAEQEAAGDPLGSTHLMTNSAGSGPYVISEFLPDQRIVLTRNESYWGEKPYFEEVELQIISDRTAQRIQMEAGDLDFIWGVDPEAANALEEEGALNVTQPDAYNMTILQVNTQRPPFSTEVLAALPNAIPYQDIVDGVFGKWATVADQTITANRVPDDIATWEPEHDPSELAAAFEALPEDEKSIPVVLGANSADSGVHGRVNDYLSEVLTEAGFEVTRQLYTSSDYFGMIGAPEAAPHIFTSTQPDDGVHPDHWYRIWMHTEGALNVGAAGLPEADALFDQANATLPGEEPPYELYAEGGRMVVEAGHFIPVADAPIIWVTQPDLEGVTVRYASDQALVIPLLSRSGGE